MSNTRKHLTAIDSKCLADLGGETEKEI